MTADLASLRKNLEGLERVLVAFSGGVDSAFLAVSYTHLTLPTILLV